jgi:hypothetical protein
MINFKYTDFFDRAYVKKLLSEAFRKNLSKLGAYIRTTAQRSIKTAKGKAKPGRPPHSHKGLLKKHILFAFDQQKYSVIVGPQLLQGRRNGAKTVPEILEFGGRGVYRGRPAKYWAHPFMTPAYEQEKKKLPGLFKDCL